MDQAQRSNTTLIGMSEYVLKAVVLRARLVYFWQFAFVYMDFDLLLSMRTLFIATT